MARNAEKPALIEKCDELGVEYKSTDSIAELKSKIADKIVNPVEIEPEETVEAEPTPEPEVVAEEAPVESVEETPEPAPEPEEAKEPKPSKLIPGKFVENAPVISVTPNGGYLQVQTTVAGYKLTEEEYENL